MKNKYFILTFLTLFIIGTLAFFTSFYKVKENEYALVSRFGKIYEVKTEAGPYFKTPIVDKIIRCPKSVQFYDVTKSDVITSDKKSMVTDNYVLWRVTDPIKFSQTLNASIGNAESRTSVAVYNATKNIISSMTQDDVVASRGTTLTDKITNISNNAVTGYGIEIVKAEIKLLDLPEGNKQAVYQRMISERENIAASYKAQGESEAQKIRNEADKKVTVMLAQAEKEASVLEAEGEAEYMRILQDAYNNEDKAEFYNYLLQLDSLKDSISGTKEKKIVLDKDSEFAKLFY